MNTNDSHRGRDSIGRKDTAARQDMDEPIAEWVQRMRRLGLRGAAPRFIVKLDTLHKTPMSGSRRVDLMRELKRPLLKLAAGLPKPLDRRRSGDEIGKGVAIEQHLYSLMTRNLATALEDMDVSAAGPVAELEKRRLWALRNLFRFFGRQIEFGFVWRRSLPEHTWRGLHDLYAYTGVRAAARPAATLRRNWSGLTVDPEAEYRRLLLIGLAGQLLDGPSITFDLLDKLDRWGARCRLADPGARVGSYDQFAVRTSRDEAPGQIQGMLAEGFRGFILIPPPEFLHLVRQSADRAADPARQDDRVVIPRGPETDVRRRKSGASG